jgi:hypothetical protein
VNASFENFLGTIRAVAAGAKILPQSLTNTLFTKIVRHAVNGGGNERRVRQAEQPGSWVTKNTGNMGNTFWELPVNSE